jgi:hypothetical protein
MSIDALVAELAANKIQLRIEDGKLRFRAPRSGLPERLRERIAEYRDDIIALLKQREQVETDDDLRPRGRDQPLPLSFEQERLW